MPRTEEWQFVGTQEEFPGKALARDVLAMGALTMSVTRNGSTVSFIRQDLVEAAERLGLNWGEEVVEVKRDWVPFPCISGGKLTFDWSIREDGAAWMVVVSERPVQQLYAELLEARSALGETHVRIIKEQW